VGDSPLFKPADSAFGGEGGPVAGGDWRRALNAERGRMILIAVVDEGLERRTRGREVRSVRDILREALLRKRK
jgi:hypothetical protein